VSHPKLQNIKAQKNPVLAQITSGKDGLIRHKLPDKKNETYAYTAFTHFKEMKWTLAVTILESELMKDAIYIKHKMFDEISKQISSITVGKTGYFFVIDNSGRILIHPDNKIIGKNLTEKYDFAKEITNKKTGTILYTFNNETKIATFKNYRNWIIAGGAPLKDFTSESLKEVNIVFVCSSISVVIILIILIAFVFKKSVTSPLKNITETITKVASGDLSSKSSLKKSDEVGVIADNLNKMTEKINLALVKISESDSILNKYAESLNNSSIEIASGAENQAKQISNIESSMFEMTTTVKEILDSTNQISTELSEVNNANISGQKILEQTLELTTDITKSAESTSESIYKLSVSSQEINEMVGMIADIADQTNLLALNAAIEAARAGEQGRGFAVVADEVRKLAEKTSSATHEINNVVSTIQKDIENSVKEMDKGVHVTKKNEEMIEKLKYSISLITERVSSITIKISSIAGAVNQQSISSEEISGNISDIAAITQENAAISKENEKQSKKLLGISEELTNSIKIFKLDK
jgi:methyl-accepting chemotaxis protein